MEAQICGGMSIAATPSFNFRSEGHSSRRAASAKRAIATAYSTRSGGLLDKPVIEKITPGRKSEFDLRKNRRNSPLYQVILHNDDYNKADYVVKVLMKVIPGMTVDTAVIVMQEAHYNGASVVIICAQTDAEDHCTHLRGNGLISSIQPANDTC